MQYFLTFSLTLVMYVGLPFMADLSWASTGSQDRGKPSVKIKKRDSKKKEAQNAFKWRVQDEDKLNQWAERHAKSWEKWAKQFENRMEDWARETEEELEDWADGYAEKWEDWSRQIENGLDEDQLRELLEKNMKMIGDLPIERLTKRLGKLGSEFEDMPLESLGELSELLTGSLEHSLNEFERAIESGQVEAESRVVLETILKQLHGSLDARQKHHKKHAQDRIDELNDILRSRKFESVEEIEDLIEQFQERQKKSDRSSQKNAENLKQLRALEQLSKQKAQLEENLDLLQAKAKELSKRGNDDEKQDVVKSAMRALKERIVLLTDKEAAVRQELDASRLLYLEGAKKKQPQVESKLREAWEAQIIAAKKRAEAQQKAAKEAQKRAMELMKKAQEQRMAADKEAVKKKANAAKTAQMRALEFMKKAQAQKEKEVAQKIESSKMKAAYEQLMEKYKRIEVKESQLDAMRREIEELRKELNSLRKDKGGRR